MLPKIINLMPLFLLAVSLNAAPTNPNATQGAKELLTYLENISGKKILSGQESMWSDGTFPSSRDRYVHSKTGKYPAIYCTDFGDFGTGNLGDRKKIVSNVIEYAKKGSIIAIQYHMIQPDLPDGSGFDAMNIKGSTYTKMDEILKEGSSLNTTFKKRLDELAGYLKQIEENGITVMFRPYHEMNGDWFWWSYQPRFKDLWIYTWKYMTETKKCNNLLWVFGVNYWSGNAEKLNPRYYYPGHDYVDILGCDVYTNYSHSYSKTNHDSLRVLGGGKPIGIMENGTMPTDFVTWRTEQPYWVCWITWWGFEGTGKGNTDEMYKNIYSHESVITQDEISSVDTDIKFIRISTEGRGTVTKSPDALTYKSGTEVTLTAAPENGWKFAGWSGSKTSTDNPLKVTTADDYELIATFTPLEGTVVNLINNGDFSKSATTGWNQLAIYEGAVATGTIVDGEYFVNITNGGGAVWHVQLLYVDVKLEQGKTYTLSFTAHASSEKSVFAKLGENGGKYTEYAGETFIVGTEKKTYSLTFSMTEATDAAARLEFNIGNNSTNLYLDDVDLHESDGVGMIKKTGVQYGKNKPFTLSIYPNEIVYAFRKADLGAHTSFSVYSASGRKIISTNELSSRIDTKLLPRGLYVVKAHQGNQHFSRKFRVY